MKNIKKCISVLLACIICIMSFGAVPIFAEDATVLFEENFDSYAENAKPKKPILAVENEEKLLRTRVKKDGDNGYLRIYCEEGGEKSQPRIFVKTDASVVKTLTLTYKAKFDGNNAIVAFATDGGKTGMLTTLASIDAKEWTDVEIVINLETMKYTVTAGGKVLKKDKALHAANDLSTAEFRFTAGQPEPGQGACFDNIKITGVSNGLSSLTPAEPSTPATPSEPTAAVSLPKVPTPKGPAIKATLPAGATAFLDTDFTGAKLGGAGKCGLFSTATAYVDVADVGSDRMLKYHATDGAKHYPRVELAFIDGVETYSVDFAFMLGGTSSMYVGIYADSATKGDFAKVTSKTAGFVADDWNYLHLDIDLKASKVTSTLNGKPLAEGKIKDIADRSTARMRINSTIDAGDVSLADNVLFYTTEKYEFTGIIKGPREVAFENVKPENPLSEKSYVNNLRAHPRIFVKDWDEMRNTINSSYEAKQWYNNLKVAADGYLESKATYSVNSRGNILESSNAAEGRLMALSFVYKITGDKRYLDKAYEEMIEYGTWPDWSGFIASLVTAGLMFGYACAYDWLYYDLTPAQRDEIREIVKRLALPDMIFNYEGKQTSTNFTTSTINWNPVCNACMIGTAFAFADEEPNLSEYILEKAPGFIINALSPYAPEGGHPEGTMYWDFGTTFLCFAMDLLEYGFKDGFELPAEYKYYNYPGIAETCDFPIYYCSSVGKFDYGDASSGVVSSEVFYWMANRFNKPQYAWYENNVQFNHNSYMSGYGAIFALASYDKNNATVAPGIFSLDKFYSSETEVNGMSMRSTWAGDQELFAAMQGGNNSESHMYWSLGTYVIDYHKKRFVDEDLSKDYALKGDKETIYYKRAEAHNTLVINPTTGPDQNKKAVAQVIKSGTSDNTAFGILDMTPVHDDYVSAKRGMMLTDNRNRVIVQDEVVAKEESEFYWFANTKAGIKLSEDGKSVILNRDGEMMLARIIAGPAEAKFTVMERRSMFSEITQGNQSGVKLAIHIPKAKELTLAVEYVGLEDGEGIPAPSEFVPLDQWTADDNGMTAVASAGTATVLKLNSPNAIAKGEKTYVDPANYDVVPFTENSRTLVPVRFISESFGANVGWNADTQTVSVKYKDKEISLQIGSNIMYVNGEAVTLDTPANTYNSRTLIPLRALVEALGKYVHWDDRGLIIIADDPAPYPAESIDALIKELNVRVTINGSDMTFFELDRENYVLNVKTGEAVPVIGASTIGGETIAVTQANAVGETATVTVDGKVYNIKIEYDPFEGLKGSKDPGVINKLTVERMGSQLPDHYTYIYVEDLEDSTGFASYPKRGIVDGVINTSTANRWAAQGIGWISMDFGSVKNLHSMAFAGVSQDVRAYRFDVEVSTDGQSWKKVHEGGAPTTMKTMSIIPLGDVQARYVRLTGNGNSQNAWNTWAEVRYYESAEQQAEDILYWSAYFGSADVTGAAGTTMPLVVKGVDAPGDLFALRDDAEMTYEIADPSIATVSADGKITFLKTGKTTLTVRASQDGYGTTLTVEVETL